MRSIHHGPCFILLLLLSCRLFAQTAGEEKSQPNVKVHPLPVIGTKTSTGFLFGVAPGAYWYFGDTASTSISSAQSSLLYTSRKQLMITLKASSFFRGDRFSMATDVRYFKTSQPTYGLGTGPQSAKPVSSGFLSFTDNPFRPIDTDQMMEFDYLRIYNTVNQRIGDTRYFVGLGLHLDYHFNIRDRLLQRDTLPYTITSHYAYQVVNDMRADKYMLNGVSLNAQYDSRDNQVNPYEGRLAAISVRLNPSFAGSEHSSAMFWLESREYVQLCAERPRHMIAFWNFAWLTAGRIPYLDLPALGWDMFGRSGRAYTQGRFRGEQLVYNEVEYRFPLQKHKDLLGAVVFVNGTTANNSRAGIRLFEFYDFACGAGLRIMVNKNSRANLNIDYAFGRYGAHGFYLGINEVF